MEDTLKYKISQDTEKNFQSIKAVRTEYGIWDHQEERLVSRYIRHINNKYERKETKYPRLFTQMNHALSSLRALAKLDPSSHMRYEPVAITVTYDISTSLPAEHRKQQLTKKQALSKLSKEEKEILGIRD